MSNYVFIATSLDGFIATKDGGIDWLLEIPNPENSDYGYNDFIKKIDGIIMGRKTFEMALTFKEWPYNKRVFVLSNSLKMIPENLVNEVEIVNGDLKELIHRLRGRGFENFYIDGGKTIQSFLKENLIDGMIITYVSVLLGEGIPLFGTLQQNVKFKAIKTEILNEHLVQTRYIRV